MKLATFNVNGVNGRLPVLLRWLEEAAPDIVCLQELKASQEKFPKGPIRDAGYGAIWHGQKSWNGVAILARGVDPVETQRGLPGDPDDTHSRYIEAAVEGLLVGCLYLPNGNPAPGPKFDFKLRWFERLATHAKALLASGAPVVLAGDYNVMPTDLDVYKPERWVDDALFRPEVRDAYRKPARAGLDRCAAETASGRAHLYVLGLFPECLRPRRRPAHRSSPAQPGRCGPAQGGGRRSRGARVGKGQRSRADMDRADEREVRRARFRYLRAVTCLDWGGALDVPPSLRY